MPVNLLVATGPQRASSAIVYISYTGRGYVGLFMFMGFGLASGFLVSLFGVRDETMLVTFAIVYALAGTPAHWVIGTRMNTVRTAHGRPRHDQHRLGAAPVQYWAVWYPIIALVVFCIVLAVGGHKGWAVVLGAAGFVALMCYGFWAAVDARLARPASHSAEAAALFGNGGQPQAGSTTRKALAAVQGWRYEDSAGKDIIDRWSGTYG